MDSSTEGMLREPPRTAFGRVGTPSLVDPSPVEFFTTFKVVYRCKHCGKEWTRTETEEREVERRYAGPEQASEADVEGEAERYEEQREEGEN